MARFRTQREVASQGVRRDELSSETACPDRLRAIERPKAHHRCDSALRSRLSRDYRTSYRVGPVVDRWIGARQSQTAIRPRLGRGAPRLGQVFFLARALLAANDAHAEQPARQRDHHVSHEVSSETREASGLGLRDSDSRLVRRLRTFEGTPSSLRTAFSDPARRPHTQWDKCCYWLLGRRQAIRHIRPLPRRSACTSPWASLLGRGTARSQRVRWRAASTAGRRSRFS